MLRTATAGIGLSERPLVAAVMPYLAEMAVLDGPEATRYVGAGQAAVWGVPPAEVFAAARGNLGRRTPLPEGSPTDGPIMLRFVEDGRSFWSSCLLLDGWLAGLADRVGGRPVAFVPDQETLIVVADEPAILDTLFDMIEADYAAAVRALSPVPYVSDANGRTVPYDAPPGHPLYQRVRRAERVLAVREYARQAELLAGTYDRAYPGAALADLSLTAHPEGPTFTATTWPAQGSALLPHADLVAFSVADGELFHVPWAEVVEHAPPRPVADLRPPRYLADGWPAEPALTALRAAAVGV